MRKYTKDHEWALVEDDIALVGISEHAVEELGDITFIEAPEIGAILSKGDSAGFVESVKAASDIYAPLSGEITEVNTRLENEPEIVNTEPLGEGWIYKMKLSDIGELDDLMSEEDYQKFLSTL
jgi:glycine cleavage system H protein